MLFWFVTSLKSFIKSIIYFVITSPVTQVSEDIIESFTPVLLKILYVSAITFKWALHFGTYIGNPRHFGQVRKIVMIGYIQCGGHLGFLATQIEINVITFKRDYAFSTNLVYMAHPLSRFWTTSKSAWASVAIYLSYKLLFPFPLLVLEVMEQLKRKNYSVGGRGSL